MRRNGALKLSIPYNTYWFEMWQLGRPKERLKMQPPSAWSWWLASSTLTTSHTYAAARFSPERSFYDWFCTRRLCNPACCKATLSRLWTGAISSWLLLAALPGAYPFLAPPGVLYITMMCHYWSRNHFFYFFTQTSDSMSQQSLLIPVTVSMQVRGIIKHCRRCSKENVMRYIGNTNFHTTVNRAYPRPLTP